MKTLSKITLFAVCAALSACGPQKNRIDPETQAKLIHENEMRLASLENNVHSLSSQLEQINNRTYEVRTRSGQKTSMTVVPVTASSPAAAPAAAPAAKPVPVGRKVEPKPKAAPVKKKAAAQPPQPAPAPANVAGPSGQLAPAETVALPPANLPDTTLVIPEATPPSNAPTQDSGQSVHGRVDNSTVPVPQGNVAEDPNTPPVPVPLLPTSDLSLPPEHPETAAQESAASQPPQSPAKVAAPVRRKAQPGEQAAYNAALNAARSGKTNEGIRLFRNFLQKYPSGPYTANAEYWIGECLYSQGKFSEAANQFESVNSAYPKHHKNADALLKAGMTLNKMGNKTAAQEKFKTLIANFPNSEAARRARAMGAR